MENIDVLVVHSGEQPDSYYAKELCRILGKYRIPGKVSRIVEKRKIGPVYLDNGTGELDEQTQSIVRGSKNIIVICSPRAANCRRIKDIIAVFLEEGSINSIYTLLIEGKPEEAFPERLRYTEYTVKDIEDGEEIKVVEEREPLAANIIAHSRRESLKKLYGDEKLRIIAPLIGCSFDDLKQRHRRAFLRKVLVWSAVFSISISIMGTGFLVLKERADAASKQAEEQRMIADSNAKMASEQAKALSGAVSSIYGVVPQNFKDMQDVQDIYKQYLRKNVYLLDNDGGSLITKEDQYVMAEQIAWLRSKGLKEQYLPMLDGYAFIFSGGIDKGDNASSVQLYTAASKAFSSSYKAGDTGLYVRAVKAGGVLQKSGLKIGDIIIGIGGKRFGDYVEFEKFIRDKNTGSAVFECLRLESDGRFKIVNFNVDISFIKNELSVFPL